MGEELQGGVPMYKKVLVLTVSLMLFALTVCANEVPRDFHGIPFGCELKAVEAQLQLVEPEDENGITTYLRINDEPSIGGSKVDRIAYLFWNNVFVGVLVDGVRQETPVVMYYRNILGDPTFKYRNGERIWSWTQYEVKAGLTWKDNCGSFAMWCPKYMKAEW